MSADKAHAAHDEGHGHGGGSQFIQHHYDDAHHQFESGKLGIWLFLAQEVLFFSALFVAYILYRFHHPEIYSYAHKYLDVKYGAINTAVLIFSSLTAAWAVRAAQLAQRKLLILCLGATLACALTFLAVKYIEYTHKVHEHLLFGDRFDPCVSSGEVPLVNRGNECPGHQSSVVWNYNRDIVDGGVIKHGTPEQGCFPEIALDQSPRAGLQLDCAVHEATTFIEREAGGAPSSDKKTGNWIIREMPEQELFLKELDEQLKAADEQVRKSKTQKDREANEKAKEDLEKKTEAAKKELEHAREEIKERVAGNPNLPKQELLEKGRMTIAKECPAPRPHHEGEAEHEHKADDYPCWRAAQQPAVCRSAWFFTARCTGGGAFTQGEAAVATATTELAEAKKTLAEAKLTGNKETITPAEAAVGVVTAKLKAAEDTVALAKTLVATCKPDNETFFASAAAKDRSDCNDARAARDKLFKKLGKWESAVGAPRTVLTMSDCTHSDQVGFLIEYGNHDELGEEVVAVASCKAPPKPVVVADPLADKEHPLVLGQKLIDPPHEVTTHEAHELESLGAPPDHTNMFFTIYFAMTGLHGIHVLFGVFVFIWLLIRAIKGQFTPDYFGPVDFAALYWHIVDLIWIFLFPLLYLIH